MRDATAILISEDPTLVETVREVLSSVPNLRLVIARGVDEAVAQLDGGHVAVALYHLAEGDAVGPATDWVREVAERRRPVATLAISDGHQASQALALLHAGAAEYLVRPLDLNRLAYLLDVLTLRARHAGEAADGSPPALVRAEVDGEPFIYGTGDRMGRLMEQVRRVAPRDATVLLGGETGTGKTRLARMIHELSRRGDEPFLVINCGALSATLIESEMFGHVRGAFTGADRDRVGKFAEAGRGTLFLDEVDSLPPALQSKLLRAVEDRVFEPVGSNQSARLRARLIAASNRELEQEVAAGRFRADLFYRLNVVSFRLPPLRERGDVVFELARTFAAGFAARAGRPAPAIDPAVRRALEAHTWPGNVRELRNVIERAVALGQGDRIAPEDLPDALLAAPPGPPSPPAVRRPALAARSSAAPLSRTREDAEVTRIVEALGKHANNRLRAAAELGVSRMTLYNKLHRYGLVTAPSGRLSTKQPLDSEGRPGVAVRLT